MVNRTNTRKAIQALGGPTKAAKELKVVRSYIYDMLNNGPPEARCYQLSALSGVPLDDLLIEARGRAA